MNKAELIRIISKRSGVPDSETKIFLELFLRKASSMLKKGEALKFSGLGYFQLQQGVTRLLHNKPDEKVVYSNLMVFYPIHEQTSEIEEKIIFNIPEEDEDEFNELDSYFSLSIGKPVIPLSDTNSNDFFVPVYGNELKKTIEAKVEKLLSSAEVISRFTKGNEIFVIGSENIDKGQLQIQWDEIEDHIYEKKSKLQNNEKITKTTSEFGHIAWDFGYDLAKQIEEESIIDSASVSLTEPSNEPSGNDHLLWDFSPPPIFEKLSSTKSQIEDENSTLMDKHEDNPIEIKEESSENKSVLERPTENNYDNFEVVKSVTSELYDDDFLKLEKDENLPWDFGKEKSSLIEENYFAKTEEQREVEENTTSSETEENNNQDTLNVVENEIEVNKKSDVKSENVISQDQVKNESNNKIAVTSYSKEKTFLPFWIALITISAIGVALYLFLRTSAYKFPWEIKSSKVGVTKETSRLEIINRNYDIPVTYSNSSLNIKNNKIVKKDSLNNLDKNYLSSSPKGGANKLTNNVSGISSKKSNSKLKSTLPKIQSNVFSQKVKDNIFKFGENYIVQVSSWQSEFVANKEAEKFRKRGYNSSVVKAVIPGKGIWYRVRVDNFKTLEEAQKFLERNE